MFALLLTVASLAPLEPASKASTSLTQRVDAAAFICVGTVERTISVARPPLEADLQGRFDVSGNLEFARVRIERVIKGDPATQFVFHEAWPTWICDTTSAAVGERALFLLGPGAITDLPEKHRAPIERALSSKLVLRNVFSGDGIMPILGEGEREFVRLYPGPAEMALSGETCAYRWKPVLEYVETLVRFAPETVTLRAQRRDATGAFDLRVLADGRRRLAIVRGYEGESVVVDALEPARWTSLRTELDALVGDADRRVGEDAFWNARTLAFRGANHQLQFFQPHAFEWTSLPAASRPAAARALEAWAVVRGTLACEACPDDRDADRKLIEDLKRPK